jgi:hypothetical protein
LLWLTFGLVACAAVEEQTEKSALQSVLEKLTPFFKRLGVATEKALARRWALWTLESEQRVVFRSIETIRPGRRWRVVSGHVKVFVQAFEAGAREPERHFADPLADPALVERWRATPKKDRVFVAGAHQDTAVIESLRARLEREGKTVFFYKFCSDAPGVLCASSTVGAIFGTAGTAVWAMSDASESSRFVSLEVEAGMRFATHQSPLYIFTPGDALLALTKAAEVRLVESTIDSEWGSP